MAVARSSLATGHAQSAALTTSRDETHASVAAAANQVATTSTVVAAAAMTAEMVITVFGWFFWGFFSTLQIVD